jgi:ABC-type transporter Mla subunit MlaD
MKIPNSPARNSSAVKNSQSVQVSTELRQRLATLASSASDQVTLSKFSAALAASDSTSPQQIARLAKLSAAAANQSYQIDGPAVSESIVNGHFRA